MLNKINLFFKTLWEDDALEDEPISTEIASAVLLCEIMKADGHLDPQEESSLTDLLSIKFSLSADEVKSLIEQALSLSESATDFYKFTSRLNEKLDISEKVHLVELLWLLAYADGELSAIEEQLIRKIADLLYLRHHEYIQAKDLALKQVK